MVHIVMGSVSDMPCYIRIDGEARAILWGKKTIGKGCDFLVGKKSKVAFGKKLVPEIAFTFRVM